VAGLEWGAVSAVSVGPDGSVFVLHRGKQPILHFDAAGTLIGSWGDDFIKEGHGLRVDARGNVWVTDLGHHMVYQLTAGGQVKMQLGRKDQPGDRLDQFNQPTDVAVLPSGEFFVSDGYGNNRVLKFDAEGKVIRAWGQKGREPGEFDTPHALCLDPGGKLYVSDRGNSRIQIFDGEGKFLDQWVGEFPAADGLYCAADGTILIATGRGNDIVRIEPHGTVVDSYGGPRSTQAEVDGNVAAPLGRFNVAHGVSLDREGNLYVAEVRSRRVQKLVRGEGK
jgi:DNA-binding beta-propeller fold protein YncE